MYFSDLLILFLQLKRSEQNKELTRSLPISKESPALHWGASDSVVDVVDVLTQLSPDEDEYHKIFLQSHTKILIEAGSHSELFLTMNWHWNYLDPSLLNHLVDELELDSVKPETGSYKSDVQHFRKRTPANLFVQTQKKKRRRISSGFTRMVAAFLWPNTIMLEDVEQFRQEYASHYSLHECAMLLFQVCPGNRFFRKVNTQILTFMLG